MHEMEDQMSYESLMSPMMAGGGHQDGASGTGNSLIDDGRLS